MKNSNAVIPAKAGISWKKWIPAFAGMTIATAIISCANSPANRVNTITGSYAYPVVNPPRDCPNFSKYPAADWSNNLGTNYGCATVTNFGAQVADPNDLIAGKQNNSYNAGRTSVSVGTYEAGPTGGGAAPSAPSQ